MLVKGVAGNIVKFITHQQTGNQCLLRLIVLWLKYQLLPKVDNNYQLNAISKISHYTQRYLCFIVNDDAAHVSDNALSDVQTTRQWFDDHVPIIRMNALNIDLIEENNGGVAAIHRQPRRRYCSISSWWRHNGHDGVSNHQPHDCFLNRLFRRRSKKTSKLRVTGLCAGNSHGTGEFPAQMASNAKNVSIWWRHYVLTIVTTHLFTCCGCSLLFWWWHW